mmetsp:Transcript_17087/g.47357  ORF Transcript_17087/g.47357 Transcript_17087/m.47357 type:complete len:206 (-) Transcript_17087:364-981(-)
MSWSSRMPSVADPNLVDISARSFSSCSTKAELESERAAPITTASSMDLMDTSSEGALVKNSRTRVKMPPPGGSAAAEKMRVVTSTCRVPKPKANLARDLSRSIDSSNPISNNKNSTPSSPSSPISSGSWMRLSCCNTTPAVRKPKMGEILKRLKTGMVNTVQARKVSRSNPKGTMPDAAEVLAITGEAVRGPEMLWSVCGWVSKD